MGRSIIAMLRVLEGLAAVANIVLSALVINWYLLRTSNGSPSSFNFLIFAPIFSLVSIGYLELTPRFAPRATHPFASLAVEATNTVFYFAGFIALAVFLSKLIFCNGTVCAVGRATSIVAAAEFSSWIATTILLAKDIFKGGLRRPGEGVSQSQSQRQQPPPQSQSQSPSLSLSPSQTQSQTQMRQV